jgi:DNA-binding IclR family transcriptional regulator
MLAVLTARGDCRRIAKCVSRQAVRYDIELDGLSDSYCSATGRVLLAHWDPALTDGYFARANLIPRTPKTVTDPDAIRGMFETIRAEGIAVSDEEHVTGSTGLAAPIWGREGKVIAALNLGVVTLRYHSRASELADLLRDGANRISARLGHKGYPDQPVPPPL